MFTLFKYTILEAIGIGIVVVVFARVLFPVLRQRFSKRGLTLFVVAVAGVVIYVFAAYPTPRFTYPMFMKTYGPGTSPALPLANVFKFFGAVDKLPHVAEIAPSQEDIPPSIGVRAPKTVDVAITAKEVIAETAPGVFSEYWTFNGTVPGPFIRVRVGDTLHLTIKNDLVNLEHHNIDFHAVTGPGGGAVVTNVAPGESKTADFKMLNPGLFVYHCAHGNPAMHMAHGMYGLILVEPEGGLPTVDKEFYVVQGELYSSRNTGAKGLQVFDAEAMDDGNPDFIFFNGRVGGATGTMKAQKGETIRLFVGNGGVNLVSSFHVIGEIFDRVYPEGSLGGDIFRNVQTTIIPAGGAAIVEFKTEVPGKYILVDHALARVDKGAWGTIEVSGDPEPEIFSGTTDTTDHSH